MSLPSDLRAFACEHLFPLETTPTAEESRDAAAYLEALPPDQRLRAIWIASRRLAVQLLFQLDAQADNAATALEEVKRTLDRIPNLGPIQAAFVNDLVLGAHRQKAITDAEVRELAPTWPAHRQPAVDRAILRLACYELRTGGSPAKVVINEAVELAKRFSTDRSSAFVNGILGKVFKNLESQGRLAPDPPPGTPYRA